MSTSNTTTDHREIKSWTKERNGSPAVVEFTETNGSGLLRIKFSTDSDESLKEIDWDEFFEIFEDKELAFLYQDEKGGNKSRFFKFVARN